MSNAENLRTGKQKEKRAASEKDGLAKKKTCDKKKTGRDLEKIGSGKRTTQIHEVKRTPGKNNPEKNVSRNIPRAGFFFRHRYIPSNGNACGESTPWLQRRKRRKAERRRKSNFRKKRLTE